MSEIDKKREWLDLETGAIDHNKVPRDELKTHKDRMDAGHCERFDWIVRDLELNPKKDIAILDVGTGNGLAAYILKHNGYSDVTGVDVSRPNLDKCKDNPELEGIKFIWLDAASDQMKTMLREQYDVILCIEIAEHIEDYQRFIGNVWEKLKPGGRLYFSVPIKHQLNTIKDEHVNFFDIHTFDAPQREEEFISLIGLFEQFTDDFSIYKINKFLKCEGTNARLPSNIYAVRAIKDG